MVAYVFRAFLTIMILAEDGPPDKD